MIPPYLSQAPEKESLQKAIQSLRSKIELRGDLPYATVQRQIDLLQELTEFALGRFLIQNQGGLNGYWTHYLLTQPTEPTTALERFLLQKAPGVKATRERFEIFRQILQKNLREGGVYASIPSRVMGDLLLLDYAEIDDFQLIGIDLDPDSLERAKALAREKGLDTHLRCEEKDAWQLTEQNAYDWVVSNGLNIYEPEETRWETLYHRFYEALRPGGYLLTSFLTPPPGINHRSEWNMQKLSMEDVLLQKLLMADLLEASWQCYQTSSQMQALLERIGFKQIQIIYDEARLFPTVCAQKR